MVLAIEPRVGQLDASILDGELLELLKTQLFAAFKYFHPEIKDKYSSELVLLLKLALFKVTIWDHEATYGAKLQHLKLVNASSKIGGKMIPMSKQQKLLYGLIVVGGSYAWTKIEDYISRVANSSAYYNDYSDGDSDSNGGRGIIDRLQKILDVLSNLWQISTLANFILFLYSGKYSTLILRLLRIRFVPVSRTFTRQVNFEFQNRQLVWNALTEFLLFALPLINLRKVRRRLSNLLRPKQEGVDKLGGSPVGELAFLPEKTCPICYKADSADKGNASTDITNPYQGDCGHKYCYVCLKSKLLEDPESGWPCLVCTKIIRTAVPYRDVDPRAKKANTGRKNGKEDKNGTPSTQEDEKNERQSKGTKNSESDSDSSYSEIEREEDDEDESDDDNAGSNFFVQDEFE